MERNSWLGDDEIPYNLKKCLEKWKENLKNWNAIEISPLVLFRIDKNNDTELHIFTDASASAYGAVAYFRCKYQGKFKCSFIMSKASNYIHLELQAAVRMPNEISDYRGNKMSI